MAKRAAHADRLEDLPNVGPAIAATLRTLGLRTPESSGAQPYAIYETLNSNPGVRHDPCVLDTFMAIVRYAGGEPARRWWSYTAERKRTLAARAAPTVNVGKRRNQRLAASFQPAETIEGLRNLGPASPRMLAEAGIASVAQLRRLGAVEAFRRVRLRNARTSMNLLWALEDALTDRPWHAVARSDRVRLLVALDDTARRS